MRLQLKQIVPGVRMYEDTKMKGIPRAADFFRWDEETGKWQCIICPVQVGDYHASRHSHIRLKHREALS